MEYRNEEKIQTEVSRSLEMLDDVLKYYDHEKKDQSNLTVRGLKNVPADARHSLEILDDILEQFDVEAKKAEQTKNYSVAGLKNTENLPSDVSKSLDDLDNVLDEFEKEGGLHSFKRRRPANKSDSIRKPRNDDIRRSLEVLDNVLAEFDDCLDCWDSMPAFSNGGDSMTAAAIQSQLILVEKEKEQNKICGLQKDDSVLSLESLPIDGSTSHNSFSEQGRISSAPPIPKRSPTTKLTGDRNSGLFVFPPDTSSLDSYDSIPSDSFTQDSDLLSGAALHSPRQPISGTLSASNDDELEQADCVSSGVSVTETMGSSNTLSPFMQRKKMFEDKIAEAGSKSPVLDRYRHASLKVSKVNRDYHDNSGPMSLSSSLSPESGFASDESPSQSFRGRRMRPPNLVKVSPPSVDFPMSSPNHAVNCNCQQRIRQLSIKFAETRRLLKESKIKALNQKPPSFIPPSPTINSRNMNKHFDEGEKENFSKPFTLEISRSKSFDSLRNTYSFDVNDVRLQQEKYQVLCEKSSNLKKESPLSCFCSSKDAYISENDVFKNGNSLKNISGSSLCRTCSRSVPTPLSETIEDISNLLPTDALNRPHLGLSYSMEDDLSPGVKEIRHTSTPKPDLSTVVHHKDSSSLSTFSLSASSLGYISSQSDLELNNSVTESDKVPVTSLRSQTLPIGVSLTPSPFYSAIESNHPSDHNYNILVRDKKFNHNSLGADLQLRSCSAPPLPEVEKTKKHFRAFSKKEKKDKKKNEDSLSLKSDLSLDEGVILRKIEAIDGATEIKDGVDKSDADAGVEKKRRSVWRSILKRSK